ncbi:MAG: methyltransferase domain-containing protein [Terrisporobacter sp.]|uniref:class I SAM-dependent methyltransferase n=1 Tax=Terrisporobacter sp. TaxID=1965305 RepID=UPI002FC69255
MDINKIKLNWRIRNNNKEANINLWDAKADHFGNYEIPNFEDDKFLSLLLEKDLVQENYEVLDVGCGGGKYTLAIASKCNYITGIDLSPRMIEYGNENKEKFNVNNVTFKIEDWHDLDIRNSQYYKKYDLVYASMTPAVQSYETFYKLCEASKGYCLIRCNTKRSDSVYDEIRNILNINHNNRSSNLDFMYSFNMLCLEGYEPQTDYEEKIWYSKETIDKAYDIYIKRAKIEKNINEDEEEKIKTYLESICEDGYICEEIKATIATLYWSVDND